MKVNSFLIRAKNIVLHSSYIPSEYYVVTDKQFVYIPIAKVACTSLKTAIIGDREACDNDEMNIHHAITQLARYDLNSMQKKYYKVAFVRHPFKRLVSCYKDKVKKQTQHNGRYYFDTKYNTFLIKRLFGNEFSKDMTFVQFVRLVAKIPDWLSDGHFKSQHSILYTKKGHGPDYIGKFESLNNDWEPIASKFGFNSLPHSNKSSGKSNSNWQDYYTSNEIIKIVKKRYMKDIVTFGYNDELINLLTEKKQFTEHYKFFL